MDLNELMKMKALQSIHNRMGDRMGMRLKPKKIVHVEETALVPKDGSEQSAPTPPMAPQAPGSAPGMPDEDAQRLMDLYSKIK